MVLSVEMRKKILANKSLLLGRVDYSSTAGFTKSALYMSLFTLAFLTESAEERKKREFEQFLSQSVSVVKVCGGFISPIASFAISSLIEVLAKEESRDKVTDRLYRWWSALPSQQKRTIVFAVGAGSTLVTLVVAATCMRSPILLKGGLHPELIFKPARKIMDHSLESPIIETVVPHLCTKILDYAYQKGGLGIGNITSVAPDKILLNATLTYLVRSLGANGDIGFINPAMLQHLLILCEKGEIT